MYTAKSMDVTIECTKAFETISKHLSSGSYQSDPCEAAIRMAFLLEKGAFADNVENLNAEERTMFKIDLNKLKYYVNMLESLEEKVKSGQPLIDLPTLKEVFQLQMADGSLYSGIASLDDVPNGVGEKTWPTNISSSWDSVDGNWPSGISISGNFVDGKLHGPGRCLLNGNLVYEGVFIEGIPANNTALPADIILFFQSNN